MAEGIDPLPTVNHSAPDRARIPVSGVAPFTGVVTETKCERLSCNESEEILDAVAFNIIIGFESVPDGIEAKLPSGFENVANEDGSNATDV
jgi:hypothetical protein